MVKGGAVEVPVSVSGFAVNPTGKTAILSSGHLNVKKGNAAISLLFHGELYVAVKPIEVVQEELKVFLSVLPDDEGVIYIPKPDLGAVVCCGDGSLLKLLHEYVSQNRGYRGSHGGSG